jgi:hypothetical protein
MPEAGSQTYMDTRMQRFKKEKDGNIIRVGKINFFELDVI